jgi:hypothetical protein
MPIQRTRRFIWRRRVPSPRKWRPSGRTAHLRPICADTKISIDPSTDELTPLPTPQTREALSGPLRGFASAASTLGHSASRTIILTSARAIAPQRPDSAPAMLAGPYPRSLHSLRWAACGLAAQLDQSLAQMATKNRRLARNSKLGDAAIVTWLGKLLTTLVRIAKGSAPSPRRRKWHELAAFWVP